LNKEYSSVIKEIDKKLPINREKKTYKDYLLAIEEVDVMLDRIEGK